MSFFGIQPDLATYAKAMGNGFPIGAIAGKKEVMEQFAPMGKLYQASTFAGNPMSSAASISTIKTLIEQKNKVYPKTARTCDSIVRGIRDVLDGYDLPICAYVYWFDVSICLLFEGERKDEGLMRKVDPRVFKLMYNELLKQGVFIPPSQFETCFLFRIHIMRKTWIRQ